MNESLNRRATIGAGLLNQEWNNYGFDFGSLEHKQDSGSPLPPMHNTSSASSTTEEQVSTEEEYVPGTFEGPEKTMEVVFRMNSSTQGGLRKLTREQLDEICSKAKCSILSKKSNHHMDAYVLSESSLFVYDLRLIMKTCGTTTLLCCLSTIFTFAGELNMELAWLGYSRKNFLFPSAQIWPHANFGEEIRYINSHKNLLQHLNGSGHILGPVTGDHWFVYVAENLHPIASPRMSIPQLAHSTSHAPFEVHPTAATETSAITERDCHHLRNGASHHHMHYRSLNMMMFDMDPDVAAIFVQSENGLQGKEMTSQAGIQALCPGAVIDEHAFSPCGYSMNAILHDAYTTIHITPESECSYVSFETNTRLTTYCSLVRHVLSIFRPQRFVMTLFGDESFLETLRSIPTEKTCINIPGYGRYIRSSCSNTKLEKQNQCCVMACYSFHPRSVSTRTVADAKDLGKQSSTDTVLNFPRSVRADKERANSIC